MQSTTDPAANTEVDIEAYRTAKKLVTRAREFFTEIDTL